MAIYNGTSGDDQFTVDVNDVHLNQFIGGAGSDTLILTGIPSGSMSEHTIRLFEDTLQNIETVLGSPTQISNIYAQKGGLIDLSNTAFLESGTPARNALLEIGYDVNDSGTGDSTIIGTSSTDIIRAGSDGGNYFLYGGGGADDLYGGTGGQFYLTADNANTSYNEIHGGLDGDTIYGGDGMNVLKGGAGIDFVYGTDNAMNHIYGEMGDNLFGGDGVHTDANGTIIHDTFFIEENTQNLTAIFIENFDFNGDILNFSLNSAINSFSDLIFNDGPPGDTIIGIQGQGEIILVGTDRAEIMNSGHLWFSNDSSEIYSRTQTPPVTTLQGTSSNDVLFGKASNDTIYAEGGNDRLYGYGGHDSIDGGAGNDRVRAGGGDDVIVGGSGKDNLGGESGNDDISGGDGSDVLYGNDGDDRLAGGAGRDYLYGGSGADTFVLDSLDTNERIKDFNLAEGDRIDISDIVSGFDNALSDINDFVSLHLKGGNKAVLKVNEDGSGNDFEYAAIIYGDLTGQTVDTLFTNGDLIA